MSSIFELFGTIALNTGGAEKQLAKISAAGKKVGSVLGKGFKVAGEAALQMGKVIGAGVAAGTTAMGKLVSSAMSAYASYEQLEGGVKKLFGDDAQNLVMEYARNAYRTAGLSANEYMDTVTSFSASLISSLGKDTVAAAAYADLAITDMADNANTFGTSMEDIQNAYKGFSKQNYTMLDNLKLGYGGTQKEMERLLADASKLSGVKYKIENFSDIIEAIHVIQDNQGIAGTTAAEAEKTISGSVNAAKAAWKNLLSGLADGEQDIDQLVSNLSETVLTAAQKNIVPRLQTMAPRLVQAVQTLVSTLGPQLPGIINTILPGMVEAATTLITGLADVLPDLLGSIIDVLPSVVKQIGGALKKLFPSLLKTFKSLIGKIDFKGLGQAIGSGLRSIVTNLPQILSDIGNAIKWAWENIAYPLIQGIFKGIFGIDLPDWDKVAESISDWWEDVKTAVGGALEIAFKAIGDALTSAKEAVEKWWGNVKALFGNLLTIVFGLGTGDDQEAAKEAVTKWWGEVKTKIGGALSIMWHLLNPFNIAKQVKNAWDRATKGLNLTVGWKTVQQTVEILTNPETNPLNPDSHYQQVISTPEGRGAMRNAGWEVIKSFFTHASGAVFSKPTLFDTHSGYHLVGEAGAEAVAPIGVLQSYVRSAVNDVVGKSMEHKLDQLLTAIQTGFGGMNQQIVLDTGVIVGATAGKMDKRLGRMALRKGRNA
nr:MAG TPA: tail tape measure protein [Caudoviricetes sp.]